MADPALRERNQAARHRMTLMALAARPRVTRDSIELAKPHPWESDDNEP